MIFTSSYNNVKSKQFDLVSISGDRGKRVDFRGKCYGELAPKKEFWSIWHSNIGKLSEIDNNTFYIEEYYKKVLSKLEPEKVYNILNNSILLCYEENNEFCHRHIVASWIKLFLGVDIPEVSIEDTNFYMMERPDYIDAILECAIKKNTNMRGFNSIRAYYLFMQAEKLEQAANKMLANEWLLTDTIEDLYTLASSLRIDADDIEKKYNTAYKTKTKRID